MAGYTRQSTFADGDTITAALFNNEYKRSLAEYTLITLLLLFLQYIYLYKELIFIIYLLLFYLYTFHIYFVRISYKNYINS